MFGSLPPSLEKWSWCVRSSCRATPTPTRSCCALRVTAGASAVKLLFSPSPHPHSTHAPPSTPPKFLLFLIYFFPLFFSFFVSHGLLRHLELINLILDNGVPVDASLVEPGRTGSKEWRSVMLITR
jgi:hypothetical protein